MNKALVVTSIANDEHPVLNQLASECNANNTSFIVIGDTKSPEKFSIEHCDFWDIERQRALPFNLAKITPVKHYSRKNLGYLIAIKNGASEICETDDDNIPRKEFWAPKNQHVEAYNVENSGWLNIYGYFTEKNIWPRGFPLEKLQDQQKALSTYSKKIVNCPVQQGLADENPDVDAIFRLCNPLPLNFEIKERIALGKNAWSPFNSQNTYWFKEAFALLYLPSYCSFRMTDIWRSYVAQRILWESDHSVLYHEPTVYQIRNEHNLMKDFEDELPGYFNNLKIGNELNALSLDRGAEHVYSNLIKCYQKLIDIDVIGKEEMPLLEAWISDIKQLL